MRMKRYGLFWRGWVCITFLSFFTVSAAAGESKPTDRFVDLGPRAGWSISGNDEDFVQVEAFGAMELPWGLRIGGLRLSHVLNCALGVLDGGGETGVIGSLGPGFHLGADGSRFRLVGGVSPTLMSKDEYGDEDFGGAFQLSSHIGIHYLLAPNLGVVCRLQHMSNAYIYDENPGLNLVMFGIKWRF